MGDRKGKSNKGRHLSKDSASQHPEANTQVIAAGIGLQFQRVDVRQIMADQKRVLDSLQMNLADKNEKIENLEQKVEELERKNTGLREEVDSKEQEIADLNTKVRALESDKEELQEEVKKLKIEVEHVRFQMKRLQAEKDEEKVQREKLGKDISIMKRSMAEIKQDLVKSTKKSANLQKQLDQMKMQQNAYTSGLEDIALDDMASIHFGEMCRQLQNKMYEEVLPKESFAKMANYKVKNIEKTIQDKVIVKTEEGKKEAATRWENLKKRIGWDDEYIGTIAILVQRRNATAHPQINKEVLYMLLNETKEKFSESGYLSVEKLNILIGMWEKLIPSKCLGTVGIEGLA